MEHLDTRSSRIPSRLANSYTGQTAPGSPRRYPSIPRGTSGYTSRAAPSAALAQYSNAAYPLRAPPKPYTTGSSLPTEYRGTTHDTSADWNTKPSYTKASNTGDPSKCAFRDGYYPPLPQGTSDGAPCTTYQPCVTYQGSFERNRSDSEVYLPREDPIYGDSGDDYKSAMQLISYLEEGQKILQSELSAATESEAALQSQLTDLLRTTGQNELSHTANMVGAKAEITALQAAVDSLCVAGASNEYQSRAPTGGSRQPFHEVINGACAAMRFEIDED